MASSNLPVTNKFHSFPNQFSSLSLLFLKRLDVSETSQLPKRKSLVKKWGFYFMVLVLKEGFRIYTYSLSLCFGDIPQSQCGFFISLVTVLQFS